MNSLKMRQLVGDQLAGINYESIVKRKRMIVKIEPTDNDDEFTVNGKTVRKDMAGIWKETEELTTTETHFFREYLNTLKETNCSGITATFTG